MLLPADVIGEFQVRIEDETVFYVNSLADTVDAHPGDRIAADQQGQVTLRNGSSRSQCVGRAANHYPRCRTFPAEYRGGTGEDLAAQGDLDVLGNIIIVGRGRELTTIDAAQLDRVFDIHPDARLLLMGVTLKGGMLPHDLVSSGAGLRNLGSLRIVESKISDNEGDIEAGISNRGTLELVRTEFTRNSGTAAVLGSTGSCLSPVESLFHANRLSLLPRDVFSAVAVYGGTATIQKTQIVDNGLDVLGDSDVQVSDSTVAYADLSVAHINPPPFWCDCGSGDPFVELVNTTISGGIHVGSESAGISLNHVTVVTNGSEVLNLGQMTIKNSLVIGVPIDLQFTSLGNNLFSAGYPSQLGTPADLASTDRVDENAGRLLGPLQDNGGPTWTYALLPGNPALDAADPPDAVWSDQRGVSRLFATEFSGPRPDIGAFEQNRAHLSGRLFLDEDGDGTQGLDEVGLSGHTVFIDINDNGVLDDNEPATVTIADDPTTLFEYEAGHYAFDFEPTEQYVAHVLPAGWLHTSIVPSIPTIEGLNGPSRLSLSLEALHVSGVDTNGVFVYDQMRGTIDRVGQGNGGTLITSITPDGRFVTFESWASNLVADDLNDVSDVFVHDRVTGLTERVSAQS